MKDPFWHCRSLMAHLQRRWHKMEALELASSLDENSSRTKTRTKAKRNLPSRPDKYAFRLLCIVDVEKLYLHTICVNGSGSMVHQTLSERYWAIFSAMCTPIRKVCEIDMQNASAMWTDMDAQQIKRYRGPSGKRVIFMNSFYTRVWLAD